MKCKSKIRFNPEHPPLNRTDEASWMKSDWVARHIYENEPRKSVDTPETVWINLITWTSRIGLTLTFKDAILLEREKTLEHFLKVINRKTFKNAYKRFNRCCQFKCTWQLDKEWFVKAVIEKPEWFSDEDFKTLLEFEWLKLPTTDSIVVDFDADDDWTHYQDTLTAHTNREI
jgi:hypothetical protein